MVVKRFDVYLVNLDPTIGAEIQKTRPCLVISPNVLDQLRTIDKSRLIKRLGRINTTTQKHVLAVLAELFAE